MSNTSSKIHKFIHNSFIVSVVAKAVVALSQIIAGLTLVLLTPSRLFNIVAYITANELAEDPHDKIVNFLLHQAAAYSVSAQLFGIIYLISHGVIKLWLALLLLKEKLWAFPVAIFIFVGFILYQLLRFYFTHSPLLLLLTLLDIFVIILIFLEFRDRKKLLSNQIKQVSP